MEEGKEIRHSLDSIAKKEELVPDKDKEIEPAEDKSVEENADAAQKKEEAEDLREDQPKAVDKDEAKLLRREKPTPEGAGRQFISLKLPKKAAFLIIGVLILLAMGGAAWKLGAFQAVKARYNEASVTIQIREDEKYWVEGASFKIKDQTYTTDQYGKVMMKGLAAGQYKLLISKDGYRDSEFTLNIKRGDNPAQLISMAKLPDKLYKVKGYVQDYVSGLALLNVQVSLGSKTAQTSPNGEYTFEKIPPGDFKLIFSKAGFIGKELSVNVESEDVVNAKVPLVPTGQVIFVSNRDGKRALYTSAYDGSGQRLFVEQKNGGEDHTPVLSPDNKWVAFSSSRDKLKDSFGSDLVKLYVVGQEGKDPKKVSDEVGVTLFPLWSPNSQRLYFRAYTSTKLSQLVDKVYDMEKGTALEIGEEAGGRIFSPDSTMIAYYSLGSEDRPAADGSPPGTPTQKVTVNQLKTFNLVTGERKTWASREEYMEKLAFGADNKSISYEAVVDGARRRYEIIFGKDAKEYEIAVEPTGTRNYVLSPDKERQAFIEQRDGKNDLFIVNGQGDEEKRLTTLGVVDDQFTPIWDESSGYLTFAVRKEAENALYVVSVEGGDPRKITDYTRTGGNGY